MKKEQSPVRGGGGGAVKKLRTGEEGLKNFRTDRAVTDFFFFFFFVGGTFAGDSVPRYMPRWLL